MASPARLHYFADSARLARRIAKHLDVPAHVVHQHSFPDGESLVRVHTSADEHAVLVHSLEDPNSKFLETLLAADALRRAGATTVTLVAPYLPYMRQDAVFHPGEPISQQVVAGCLRRSFDAVLTIEPHLHRTARFTKLLPGRSLTAAPAIAAWLGRQRGKVLVVGPDEESQPWVQSIANAAAMPWVVGRKQRYADRRVRIAFPALPACSRALIVDDIASSGATIAIAARALARAKVAVVDSVVVHAIFADGAERLIRNAGVRRLLSCNTIPHPTNAIDCSELLAGALREGTN